jgi:glycosyltransferase involved in cell wall biosynthesis
MEPREGLLFVGRLSQEKGVHALAQAVAGAPDIALGIAGDGPEAAAFDAAPHVQRFGNLKPAEVLQRMRQAVALVLPSICYENFPRTLAEAFACGLPVIASRLGAMQEIVRDGETGLLVAPGDTQAWRDALRWALAHPDEMAAMGRNARQVYERQFSADENYRQLLRIYEDAHASNVS